MTDLLESRPTSTEPQISSYRKDQSALLEGFTRRWILVFYSRPPMKRSFTSNAVLRLFLARADTDTLCSTKTTPELLASPLRDPGGGGGRLSQEEQRERERIKNRPSSDCAWRGVHLVDRLPTVPMETKCVLC